MSVYDRHGLIKPVLQTCSLPEVVIYSHKKEAAICRGGHCLKPESRVKGLAETVRDLYHFFYQNFKLCGLDGKGKTVPIHIDWENENAQWNCTDGQKCSIDFHNRFIIPSVVVHEHTHGIVHHVGQLLYQDESGALNESIADVFAVAFKHWKNGGETDWKIGNLRDLSLSKTFEQYKVRQEEPSNLNDFGHVHNNSKIPSHAFYVACKISGLSSWNMAKIWFEALKQSRPTETFRSFAERTIHIAEKYNIRNGDRVYRLNQYIREAWNRVKVTPRDEFALTSTLINFKNSANDWSQTWLGIDIL